MKARPAKSLLSEPSSGPYVVVSQTTISSAKFKDPATELSVDGRADIPLEQILAGPRRGLLKFESSEGDASTGQMETANMRDGFPHQVKASGWTPSTQKGWKSLITSQVAAYRPDVPRELSIAYVLYNDRNNASF